MTLNFPNACRSYDARGRRIRFWGHDGAMEIAFFVEVDALDAVATEAGSAEAGHLVAFDAALEQIHAAARKAYKRGRKASFCLTAADLERSAAGPN